QPNARQIADDEDRITGAAVDELSGTNLALNDCTADWRKDRRGGIDNALGFKVGNFLVRLAENAKTVARGFERDLRRLHIVLRGFESGARVLNFLERRSFACVKILLTLVGDL